MSKPKGCRHSPKQCDVCRRNRAIDRRAVMSAEDDVRREETQARKEEGRKLRKLRKAITAPFRRDETIK